ncbi:UbiD decarboxylyase family [Talaromyces proteolyticus]|uniref:Ferulic acid decarboxylase 1 n=1 Tax=Talaromyces proteolyticus TaxID=1131652 RepID=A0AAD4KYL8_9EURO|nr:UbiD decarboxylyase family [Talaromyces proteolyticus]KAH8703034.1 UbiD decarboxylyase family [Talaromyces proteolyticus]
MDSSTLNQNPAADFRTFIDVLLKDNDLAEINCEVDPHLEVGAVVRRVSEVNGKAPLFNNIKGAKGGLWRMFGNAACLRNNEEERYGRIARNLGLARNARWADISQKLQAALKAPPVPPNVVATGPCKQNKIEGNEIDLNRLPVPLLHKDDGGKYIQTYGMHVLQAPDGNWTNWSIFRGMVHDNRHIVCLVGGGQHVSIIFQKWKEEGKTEIPWALALGVPPAASIAAALPLAENVSEAEFVGALLGKPLDLVTCELSDLLVPANSEIVLEGTLSLTEKGYEGPFEDYLGILFKEGRRAMPLFKVNTITYRDSAILPISVPGRITDESHTTVLLAAPQMVTLLQQHNIPVKEAFAPLETMATWCALQIDIEKLGQMKTTPEELCNKIGKIVFNDKSAMLTNRILVVGDDVAIDDFKELMWAFVNRCHPSKDEYVFDDVTVHPLSPYMHYKGTGRASCGGKIVSNCLLPMEYEGQRSFRSVDFNRSYPVSVKDKVIAGWEDMGFERA